MGKLMHNTQIKHSSHPHLLQLSSNLQLYNTSTCAGCNLFISSSSNDHIYACTPCNFFLHPSCSKFPELITHPSHPQHTLSLLPTPIYPGGFFRCECDACAQQGSRFSYHCQFCDFDLHVMCASKPLSLNRAFHPHPLLLTFSSPYGEKMGFSCDVCTSVGSADQWLYRCVSCEFDVHLHCAAATPTVLHHNHSFPGATHHNQPLSHTMSSGHAQTYWQPQNPAAPVAGQTYLQSQPQAPVVGQTYLQSQAQAPAVGQTYLQSQPQASQTYLQSQPQAQTYLQPQPQPQAPVGGVQSYQPAAATNQNGNGLADVMVTGFVDGMMQQLGQNFVQSLTGGGDGGGGGGGGGGDVVNIDFQCSTVNEEDYNN